MAQPRKYSTDADRYRAYRQRKKERVEALAREVKTLSAAKKAGRSGRKRGLVELRQEITRRRKGSRDQTKLLDHIEAELDRLMQ